MQSVTTTPFVEAFGQHNILKKESEIPPPRFWRDRPWSKIVVLYETCSVKMSLKTSTKSIGPYPPAQSARDDMAKTLL